jgi:hypothetical protein
MKLNKSFVIIFIFILILSIIILSVYKDLNIKDIINLINIFNKEKLSEESISNVKSFKPMDIKENLLYTKYNYNINYNILYFNNNIIFMPIPDGKYLYNYKDTLYFEDGSTYISVSTNRNKINEKDECIVNEYKIGFNKPIIFEVVLPKSYIVLYIKCYSSESYSFYKDLDYNKISFKENNLNLETLKKEFYLIDDKLSYLDKVYLEIVDKYNKDFEGYSDFIKYNDKIFTYHRKIGEPSDSILYEYHNFKGMGYEFIEYGNYYGIEYIKFKEVLILIKYLTSNSILIYYVN